MSLPSGYTRLEYIESTGTQYINTKVTAPAGVLVECDIMLTAYAGNLNTVFGAVDAESPYFRDYLAAKNSGAWELGAYGYSDFGSTQLNAKTAIQCCTISGSISCTINDAAQTVDTNIGVDGSRTSLPIYLFGMNFSGGLNLAKMRLYGARIYLDAAKTNLCRDFIPCTNASGVVGLWDAANGLFYANAGTGVFTAGPEYLGSHKALVNGTLYDMTGGKCLIGGTGYSIKKGKTLIGGTGYDIALGSKTWLINKNNFTLSLQETYINFTAGNGKAFIGMRILYLDGFNAYRFDFNTGSGSGDEAWQIACSITKAGYSWSYSWTNEAYRTVTFEEEPTGRLLTWLEKNAVLQQ